MTHRQKRKSTYYGNPCCRKGWLKNLKDEFPEYNRPKRYKFIKRQRCKPQEIIKLLSESIKKGIINDSSR
jgi:hypothetical protein